MLTETQTRTDASTQLTQDAAESATVPPPPKRFKFASRRQLPSPVLVTEQGTVIRDNELSHYLAELDELPEETNALAYWLDNESQYPSLSKVALDLISAPASQAYVERIFSLCGDLTARKRNRCKKSLECRVFLKVNSHALLKLSKA